MAHMAANFGSSLWLFLCKFEGPGSFKGGLGVDPYENYVYLGRDWTYEPTC